MQAIILAAGKGKRMNSKTTNKVLLPLAGRPMIGYTIDLLKKIGINDIPLVVGFKKEMVKKFLGKRVLYAEQKQPLGTAKAVSLALKKMTTRDKNVFILNGDDSAFYTKTILNNLLNIHKKKNADISMLTLFKKNPKGLGRVVRGEKGEVLKIVEEKNATTEQLKIKEVNPACYVVKTQVLEKFLPQIKKNQIAQEYYFTDIIFLIANSGGKIETLRVSPLYWHGINTPEEYREADKFMKRRLKIL